MFFVMDAKSSKAKVVAGYDTPEEVEKFLSDKNCADYLVYVARTPVIFEEATKGEVARSLTTILRRCNT